MDLPDMQGGVDAEVLTFQVKITSDYVLKLSEEKEIALSEFVTLSTREISPDVHVMVVQVNLKNGEVVGSSELIAGWNDPILLDSYGAFDQHKFSRKRNQNDAEEEEEDLAEVPCSSDDGSEYKPEWANEEDPDWSDDEDESENENENEMGNWVWDDRWPRRLQGDISYDCFSSSQELHIFEEQHQLEQMELEYTNRAEQARLRDFMRGMLSIRGSYHNTCSSTPSLTPPDTMYHEAGVPSEGVVSFELFELNMMVEKLSEREGGKGGTAESSSSSTSTCTVNPPLLLTIIVEVSAMINVVPVPHYLVNDKDFTDLTVIVTKNPVNMQETEKTSVTTLYAHRAILAAASPVFKATFLSGMSASQPPYTLHITDHSVEAVQAFLTFLYTAKCGDDVIFAHGSELLSLAHMYAVPHLLTHCWQVLLSSTQLTAESATALLPLAQLYGPVSVHEFIAEFLADHPQI